MWPRTTPQRLRLLAVLLVPAVVLLAVASWLRVARAGDTADELRTRHLPAVLALDQVAEGLTEADRAAARELTSGAFPLTGPGTDYQDAVKTAGQALADARERFGQTGEEAAQLRAVDGLIIEYTGLVGMAQSGREGPLAVAGIVYASDLLHEPDTGILARVAQLRDGELAAIRDARGSFWASSTAVVPLVVLGVFVVVLLVWASVYMRRRFRRHLNVPVLLALTGVVLLSGWHVENAARVHARVDAAAGDGTVRLTSLWEARTAAQRVVGAESLALVTRGLGGDHRAAADDAVRALGAPAVPEQQARADATSMAGVLATIRARGFGREPTATDLAPNDTETLHLLLGGGSGTLTGLASDADGALSRAIADSRVDTMRRLTEAGDDQGLATGGPLVCGAVLALGLWGLWRRYDEYRAGG
ncbi:hypothetical protein [Yinghuangia seranimata]|uniref:hypothetical protein n=1 Tax=Yinghuangia seranimata TaxID=408067 RepID=UPI00248CE8AE|nr:hypothetical protein [Yinghuangia seranimata]MDI2125219.1 hypothetical protein [Yinghuangia seranimata]